MPPGKKGFQKGHDHGPKPGEDRARGKHNQEKAIRLRTLCAEKVEAVFTFWVNTMNDENRQMQHRLAASQMIIERAFGKAPQAISLEDGEGGPAQIIVNVLLKKPKDGSR